MIKKSDIKLNKIEYKKKREMGKKEKERVTFNMSSRII